VHDRAEHRRVILLVAQVPEQREEHVGVVLGAPAVVVDRSESEARSFGCLRSTQTGNTVLKLNEPLVSE